ncbi:phage GP46 family protein [uncultured Pigmentiphaga sp.]|uniref:phage GP46 family protein n=1 Tax=uncultured Pigmentiphaga sp. TaxID=340361 RepID=UPI002630A27E|nr:phage GP46 family protein [uncultured Pigmentiphaga sp.]
MDILIRTAEGQEAQPFLLWDSVWDPAAHRADWALAGGEALNVGGLRARSALETAVVLALFTDRRVPDDHPLRKYADADPRGWWGDGVDVRADLGEEPLGSLLWLLERAALTEDVSRWAKAMAEEALMPLLRQGAAARVEVETSGDAPRGRLDLMVRLYGADGQKIYDRRFEIVWLQELR